MYWLMLLIINPLSLTLMKVAPYESYDECMEALAILLPELTDSNTELVCLEDFLNGQDEKENMNTPENAPSYPAWDDVKQCDWCGRDTYGRIYNNDPDVVYCTSCHTPIEGNPKNLLELDVDTYCAQT